VKNNELSLRTIDSLLPENFFVPSYQRGYRWTSRQVEDLLDDVLEFTRKEMKSTKEFYCLQPVVVREMDGKWEVIDGQQRLTTIYIILSYLNGRFSEDFRKQLFGIEYATRPHSRAFLESIDQERRDENLDFYHIFDTYITIRNWFADKANLINDIESAFLNKVKVIWYEVKEEIDPIDVFTRLNIGKIPLTNAELVKALLLRARALDENTERSRLVQGQIAQEWDEIERALQRDDFWFFLCNRNNYDNRIEFILDLIAENRRQSADLGSDFYATFIAFNRWFQEEHPSPEDAWREIKYYFMQLAEWHRDRYLFHLIGFLIHQGVGVDELKRDANNFQSKEAFRGALRARVFGTIFARRQIHDFADKEQLGTFIRAQLEDWTYGSRSRHIHSVLLLFNVASLIRNRAANLRFQFDKYKNDQWDLEHIKSVMSDMPRRADEQKEWLTNVLAYFLGDSDASDSALLGARISAQPSKKIRVICSHAALILASSPFDQSEFERVYGATLRFFKESRETATDHSIANLALLDARTNRSYQNAVFPIKRSRIIELDKRGSFVPLCTKNTFLKYYSNRVDNMMFWTGEDRDYYFSAIVETLLWFFCDAHEVQS
jgi:hypothetical protein